MNDPRAIKVLIRNAEGQYLAGAGDHWTFTAERARATVFDYLRDRVPDQLEWIQRACGTSCTVVRLEPREAYESCDRCGRLLMAFQIFFDGRQFLCSDCRPARATVEASAASKTPAQAGQNGPGFARPEKSTNTCP